MSQNVKDGRCRAPSRWAFVFALTLVSLSAQRGAAQTRATADTDEEARSLFAAAVVAY